MDEKNPDKRIRLAVTSGEEIDDCPVKALGEGIEGGKFYFLSVSGTVRAFTHRDMTKGGIDSLFGGNSAWLVENHPMLNRKGKPTGDWNYDKARSDLLRRADHAGWFVPDEQIRGPGTWRGDAGGLIVHCGDRVLIGTDWHRAGFIHKTTIEPLVFPRYPRVMAPPAQPAEDYQVEELLDFLNRWSWRWGECAPRLMLGWIFGALVCGALDWRPHVWVTGGKNHGKSTLESLVFGILGGMVLRASDPSGAGVRNALNGAAMPVALDEVEFDPNNRRAQDCIELARIASTDNQGNILRATPHGGSNSWAIRACFYFTSILHAPMKPQDLSRITMLELEPLPKDADKRYVRDQIDKFHGMAPAFHARLIQSWDRFKENLITYEEALSDEFTYRVSDQFGTMLAIAETMLNDAPADPDDVAVFLHELDIAPQIDGSGLDDPEECLNRLMSWPADLWRSGDRQTVGSLVQAALTNTKGGETERGLPKLGIRLRPIRGKRQYLAVANNHSFIERIFQDTRFAQGGWRQALERLPGARRSADMPTVYFAGATSRAAHVPITLIKDHDNEEGEDPVFDDPSGPPFDE